MSYDPTVPPVWHGCINHNHNHCPDCQTCDCYEQPKRSYEDEGEQEQ